MKKEFIKLSGILCAITLIAALLLAGVNKITAPKIAEAEEKASQDAMKRILPKADDFDEVEENVFAGTNEGTIVGYCVKTVVSGYGGDIEMMVAFDRNEKVCGIEILSHSETAGLGAKAAENEFKDQFKGKNSAVEVVKNQTSDPGQITAITGATITSKAVAETGIGQAWEVVKDKLAEEKKNRVPNALKALVPEAAEFEHPTENIYLGIKDDAIVGYCVRFYFEGQMSGSKNEVVAGYNTNGKFVGAKLIEQSDGYILYKELPENMQEYIIETADSLLIDFNRQSGGGN